MKKILKKLTIRRVLAILIALTITLGTAFSAVSCGDDEIIEEKPPSDQTENNESADDAENESADDAENESADDAENESADGSESETTDGSESETTDGSESETTDGSESETTDGSESETTDGSESETTDGSESETTDGSESETTDGSESETTDGSEDPETAKTVATLTDIQDLSKTYDKTELANPTFTTNSDGAVSFEWYEGETKLDAKPVNAGTYKVKITVAESATYTGVSAEKEFTIAKRPIWAENVEFDYDGYDEWTGEEAKSSPVFQNLADGESFDYSFVGWFFDSKNVGATLTSVEFTDEDDGRSNYTIDFSKCSAEITRRTLSGLTLSAPYNGETFFEFEFSGTDVLDGDTVILQIGTTVADVGEYTLKNGKLEEIVTDAPSGETINYEVDASTCTFTVTPKKITLDPSANYTAEYNGTSSLTVDISDLAVNGETLEMLVTATKTVTIGSNTAQIPIILAGEYEDVTLGKIKIANTNYEIEDEILSGITFEITKKKLTNLDIKITAAVADALVVTLIAKDGVIPGDTVKLELPYLKSNQDFYNGDDIEMLLDINAVTQGQDQVVLLEEGDYGSYELVPDDNGVVGIISMVDSCDVQFDGSCNCGNSHITASVTSGNVRLTASCATTWESGIYELTTTAQGYWSIRPSDNFCNIDKVYDKDGNGVEYTSSGFYASKNTYYVHISRASESSLAQTIQFTFANTLTNLDGAAAKSNVITASSGYEIFFRIEEDAPWGASMNVFSDDETTRLDPSKYTVKVYDEYFSELTGVIYDGTDVYHSTDEDFSVVDKTIYIGVALNADTGVQIYIY